MAVHVRTHVEPHVQTVQNSPFVLNVFLVDMALTVSSTVRLAALIFSAVKILVNVLKAVDTDTFNSEKIVYSVRTTVYDVQTPDIALTANLDTMVATVRTTVRLAASIDNVTKNLDTVRLVVLKGIMVMVMIVSPVQTNVKAVLIKPRAQYVKQDIGGYHVKMIVLCSVQSALKMENVYLVSLV